MKSKVSRTRQRTAILKILEQSSQWDADTLHIDLKGNVTAKKSSDKVPGNHDFHRFIVCHVSDMLDESYQPKVGW